MQKHFLKFVRFCENIKTIVETISQHKAPVEATKEYLDLGFLSFHFLDYAALSKSQIYRQL